MSSDMSTEQAFQAQALHQDSLLDKQNVVGVAVGFKEKKGESSGEVAVIVLVEEKKPLAALSAQDVIPKELEGMRTDVYEVGYLRAQQTAKERFRPVIPAGVSIGHYKITAGTLGVMVNDRVTGATLILSNNHVLANSNDAVIGDPILQPAAMDGGMQPSDIVARLERFVRLRYTDETVEQPPPPVVPPPVNPPVTPPTNPPVQQGCDIVAVIVALANALAALFGSEQRVKATTMSAGSQSVSTMPAPTGFTATASGLSVPENRLDAALARPVDPAMFSKDIRQIGAISGTKEATLGMRVRKYGRTTEYTEGNVTLINATVNIAYNTAAGQKSARFVGQTITGAMSQGGDSGSLVVDAVENKAVGLLFAGSNLATIFTPIGVVLNELNITI